MKTITRIMVGTALAVGFGCTAVKSDTSQGKRTWIPRERGLYRSQVHRGGGGRYPDNALETFLWCWGKGCTPDAMFAAIGELKCRAIIKKTN